MAPPDVTNAPLASTVKSPALVKYVEPELLTIKYDSPERHKSYGLSVLSVAPCIVEVDIEPTLEPRPICIALVPPLPVSALGPVAVCVV